MRRSCPWRTPVQSRATPPGIPPGQAFNFTTGAYPNQLHSVALHGPFAYLPNTGASPNGPVRFNVNTPSLLSVLDRNTNVDAGQTIHMHLAVAQQSNPTRRFITQPWSMAFKNTADEGLRGQRREQYRGKVRVDPTTGRPRSERPRRRHPRVPDPHRKEPARHRSSINLDTRAF